MQVRIFTTPVQSLPDDLYIPPEAFAVWLEQFEGPLDFLLYLVKKNNFDITTTAILPITEQYLSYINELDEQYFELAGDYLLMTSTLINIKSSLLLPTPKLADDEKNPTKQLIRRLEEYAQIKAVSKKIDMLIRLERDVFLAFASLPDENLTKSPSYPVVLLTNSLINMQIKPDYQMHHIKADIIPLAERMANISQILASRGKSEFGEILDKSQGRLGVVVSFVAILELAKQKLIDFALIRDNATNINDLTLIWTA
ncbi:chromosome segregation and condensation protein ScpA [Moraxella macacae 0408225]|uniref:Segregation and condensation protein A n=1 Tax=Moraxella macacae 0408225 TaxID=1230338 RepID=L2F5S1_9GAMM|nr:segregation/condensation protein A [Moraxella macacae]ELA08106.1 chromosome segregation and condensation protein ScpA [Moraxella macacae 0408225]